IRTDNHWVPDTCRSIAGAEGRCLSECLPEVSSQPLLPQSTCAPGSKCVPCYDPTSSNPTAPTHACELGCDKPRETPVILTCPRTGRAGLDRSRLDACSPACGGAHCLPAQYVPADEQKLLAPCPGGFCAPDPIIESDNHWIPSFCRSIAGAEGRCLSTCLPEVSSQPLLPQSTCSADERCVPCYDPTSSDPTASTHACELACDQPREPPAILTSPSTAPPPL